ncbi:N-acetyltransferase family protein [Kribbella sp. CA-247076]|uniref:GNAT family N-acetyltransferase n=1 Tax=Kribbella sp. CA-247076 TaxID=3239941 RepID=UPI003D8D6376
MGRHYRGAYADSFLDGDIDADRREVWAKRLADPGETATVLAEYDGRLAGFVHVMFDRDPRWGSLVDNLHVDYRHHRGGIGTELMARAARAVTDHVGDNAMYLWVLEQNTRAREFYRAAGGEAVETSTVPPPGGDPTRLNGTPTCLRIVWPDASTLGHTTSQ